MRLVDFLRSVELFKGISFEQLEQLAPRVTERILQPGDILFDEGQECEAIYLLAGGFLELSLRSPSGQKRPISTVRDGATLGEAEMVADLEHTLTATAGAPSRVLCVDRRALSWLVGEDPGLMRRLVASAGRQSITTATQLLNDERLTVVRATAGRTYAVYGPRGGSGRTTVALNLAAILARSRPGRVALLDLGLPFGHSLLAAGLDAYTSLADVPEQWLDNLDLSILGNALATHDGGFAVLPAANSAEQSESVNSRYVKAALRVLRRHYDAIVIDCPTVLNDAAVAAVSEADQVLVVAEPRVHAVADLSTVKRLLSDNVQVPADRVAYLTNQRAPMAQINRAQMEDALGVTLLAELPHAGQDGFVAFEHGEVLAIRSPRNQFVVAMERLAASVQPNQVRQPLKFERRRSGALLSRLKRAG